MNLVSDLDLPVSDSMTPAFAADTWLARSPQAYLILDRESGEFFLRHGAVPAGGAVRGCWLCRGQHPQPPVLTAFATQAAADRWRPVMRGYLERLWARIGAYGECDFVPAIARPYPALTIAAVLGAPHTDAGRLHEWAGWVQRQSDVRALDASRAEIERAVAEVQDYVLALLRGPRDAGGCIAELRRAGLPETECVHLVVNLLAGGIDTVAGQLTHAIRLFATHPDQWELLAERPLLAAAAADEVIRYQPVTPFITRICRADIGYRGVLFPAGTVVAVCVGRANRDDGEAFDISARRDGRALTFGAHCVGANLARAELDEALGYLAPRMTFLALAAPPELDKLLITWK